MLKDRDVLSGFVLTVLSAVLFVTTLDWKSTAPNVFSENSFFPRVLLAGLFLCGIILIFQGCKRERKEALPDLYLKKVLPQAACMIVYVILFQVVGFIPATVVFLFGSVYLYGVRKWYLLVLFPVLTSFLVYYLFVEVFRTYLG